MAFKLTIVHTSCHIWLSTLTRAISVSNVGIYFGGTNDKLIIKDWYLDSRHRIEQFQTTTNVILQGHEIAFLVAAMTPLTKPETGQTDLPPGYEAVLDPLISALWLA